MRCIYIGKKKWFGSLNFSKLEKIVGCLLLVLVGSYAGI
jgi:type IV secretory pathway VirB2 component (pilin)